MSDAELDVFVDVLFLKLSPAFVKASIAACLLSPDRSGTTVMPLADPNLETTEDSILGL